MKIRGQKQYDRLSSVPAKNLTAGIASKIPSTFKDLMISFAGERSNRAGKNIPVFDQAVQTENTSKHLLIK